MSNSAIPLPCGSWPSLFTTEVVTGKTITFSELTVDGDDIYWLERRPSEHDRTVLVKWNEDAGAVDVTPHPFSVGTSVHEYGGGAYHVNNGKIIFSDLKTNAVWFIDQDQQPRLIFQQDSYRFTDFRFLNHSVICVAERHEGNKVNNFLVALELSSPHQLTVIAQGTDFYSSPRISPDRQFLTWIEWDHPFMPWEATRLYVAEFDIQTNEIHHLKIIAGIDNKESLIQPEWVSNNKLLVCSDRNNFWNLYEVDIGQDHPNLQNVAAMNAEIGLPQWVFGQHSWHKISKNHFIAQKITNGNAETILLHNGRISAIDLDYPESCPVPLGKENSYAWIENSPLYPAQIIMQDHHGNKHVLASSSPTEVDPNDISFGQPICFPTQDQQQSYGFFYPPKNHNFCSLNGEPPPLLVLAHGGPTGQTNNAFSPRIQFWTSRGFAVVDINYRGSTGFGKHYRNALQKQWGVIDVQDCIDACLYLIKEKKVDPKRIVIRGSSAGGYTVLTALIQSNIFAAGSCLYGVGDLTALAEETHKFEARYLDGLIGKYPEEKQLYIDRSPLTHIQRIQSPLIVFQGLKDKVVPPSQAEAIVAALKENHLPYAYYTFPEEGHGFRQQATQTKVLEMELSFFGKILGFIPADLNEEVIIHI